MLLELSYWASPRNYPLALEKEKGTPENCAAERKLCHVQGSAKRRGCLLSYSQAEPGRELTQPSPRLLAEPCTLSAVLPPNPCHDSFLPISPSPSSFIPIPSQRQPRKVGCAKGG